MSAQLVCLLHQHTRCAREQCREVSSEASRARSIWHSLKALTAADPLATQTQKNKDGLIDVFYIFGIEMADAVSEPISWYCGDLIDHESRKSIETVAFIRRDRNAKQRRLSWIGCHDADRDGFGGIEAVIL